MKLTRVLPKGWGTLGKKLNCKSCVPACTRDNLFGLKLRLYRYGINAGAAVGWPHSHGSEGHLGPRAMSLRWGRDTDTS